jgi:hypothetical protein
MFVRTTQLEIDTVRTPMDEAVDLFETAVLPELREQPGFRGLYVATTPEGKALLVSFWDAAEQADAGADAVWYWETLGRFATLFRSPPSRTRYEVKVAIDPERTPA